MTRQDIEPANPIATPFPVSIVGGVPFHLTSIESGSEWIADAARSRLAVSVRLANAYCVALTQTNPAYSRVMRAEGVNFADGTPVAWAARLQGVSAARAIRGPSLFKHAVRSHAAAGLRAYFLGASEGTLRTMIDNLRSEVPSLDVAGSYSPPFAAVDDAFIDDCVQKIEASSPDLVWVGLGTPKQDFVSTEIARRIGRPCVGVGAAFDFVAGSVKEAPVFIQNSGLEWLHRLLSEPKRLWRRYTIGNTRFLIAVARHWNRSK